MSFLDALKTLGINIKGGIHIFSGNNVVVNKNDNRKTYIDITKLDALSLAKLQAIIPEAVQQENAVVLEEKSKKLLDDFRSIDQQHKDMVDYFRGKIPATDIEILRAAIYLKSTLDQKRPVAGIKEDLNYRYGQRGNNISNLYSAGYFESVIKPLYEEMKKLPDFSLEQFQKTYDKIVTQIPFAVFCNKSMTAEELKQIVIMKVKRNVRYGIRQLNIHGIGRGNADKVLKVVEELAPNLDEPPTIDSGPGFINVMVFFRADYHGDPEEV